MNILISLFLLLGVYFQTDLATVRSNFEKAGDSKGNTTIFYNSLKDYNGKDNTIAAYKGAAFALQARYTGDRKHKKELFVAGAKDLEAAIAKDPTNVELRFIRLIIQENTPKILKYKGDLTTDKQMIITSFAKQPTVVKEAIKRYALKKSTLFTAAELRKLN